MRKRKKPKKSKLRPLPSLSAQEENLLISLLQDSEKIDPARIKEHLPSPELAQAFVERLPTRDRESLKLILAVREAYGQKNVQKAIKKALFRLKQKGISIPDLAPPKAATFTMKREESPEPSAYLGPVDGLGSRAVFVVLPQIPKGVDLGMGVVNDEKGIIQFVFGRYSKKRMKEVKDLFFDQFPHMVETSPAHAGTTLERAYGQQRETLRETAKDYLQMRPWILENVSLLPRSVIYDYIPQAGVADIILTDALIHKLLSHKLLESWIIDPAELEPLADEIAKAEQSPILVSTLQRSNRIEEIKQHTIADLYPDSKRVVLKNRLEEMAYIFFKLDKREYMRLCLATAISFDRKDSFLAVNPFLKAILERSLSYYQNVAGEPRRPESSRDDSSSRIIIP